MKKEIKEEPKKKAVVYARYSSHRQGEQSIEGQLAEAYKYAAAHGIKIIHEYIDRAMTGRNDNREQFQKMLRDTAKKQFETIILWKIDRFGRNREEIAFNKYRCKKNGVKVVYVAESIPDSPEGVILESVLEGMAEYYSLQLSQNIRRGQRASAEKCQCTGGNRPLGYRTDPKTKKFVIDEETAPTVKMIFEMYANGMPLADVIRTVNNKGLRTLRGNKFDKNSFKRLLKNEKYIGVYKYKDDILVEGGIPAIIDKETFERVQEMLKKNQTARPAKGKKADFLLTDKIFCGRCGEPMIGESGVGKTGKVYYYYTCTDRKNKKQACKKKPVPKDKIEKLVIDKIAEILHNKKLLDMIIDKVYDVYREEHNNDDERIMLNKKLAEIHLAQENILKAIEQGMISPLFKDRTAELTAQQSEIESELASIEAQEKIQLTKEHIRFFLEDLASKDIDDTDVQKKLIDTFLNAVFVYDESVTFAFNYSNNGEKVTRSEVDNINGSGDFFECGYDGGDDETRTHYLYNANVALSQMSYAPKRL